jgi:hypothetical protein
MSASTSDSPELVWAEFEVEFAMRAGHGHTWHSGVRPNHRVSATEACFMGRMDFQDGKAEPGVPTHAIVRALGLPEQMDFIRRFGAWTVWAGSDYVGIIRVIREVEPTRPDQR